MFPEYGGLGLTRSNVRVEIQIGTSINIMVRILCMIIVIGTPNRLQYVVGNYIGPLLLFSSGRACVSALRVIFLEGSTFEGVNPKPVGRERG